MFNAFKYTKQLEETGFSRAQAEMQLQVISEIVEGDLATKQDLHILKNDLEHAIQQTEYRLTIKLGTLFVVGFTTMITILKFWIVH